MKKKELILVGGGGHCRACIDVIEAEGHLKIAGILDVPSKVQQRILKYKVIGTDREWERFIKQRKIFLITLGQIGDLQKRALKFEKLKNMNAQFATVISPRAYVSSHARVGMGTIVMHQAVVNINAVIGENCIINTKAVVEHDVLVGDHCHISTGSVVNGLCRIGNNTFIGSNAVIKEGLSICDNVVVGAGSVVIRPIIESGTYVGSPARKLPSRSQRYVLNNFEGVSKIKKVVLLTKEEKPTVKEVIEFLNAHFEECIVYRGHLGDKFPLEVLEDKPDILISYISPWIVPKEILEKTRLWNINFHPGSPEYPGTGCFNFASYNQEKIYGTTAHLMTEKVDTGKIIAVKRFSLSGADSVYALSLQTYDHMLQLFYETINYILTHNQLPVCSEVWKRRPYKRRDLEELCRLDHSMSKDEIQRRVQATDYLGKPGAYIEIEGHKFEFDPTR